MMSDKHLAAPATRRRLLCLAVASGLLLPAVPALASTEAASDNAAAVAVWEFFTPRARDFSRLRKVPDTIAIEFAGQRVDTRSWARLSESDKAIVRQAQVPALGDGDEPPYPSVGLKPLVERLHSARGPVNQPLRMHFTINALGDIEGLATDVPVPGPFLNELLQLLVSSGFKPGLCGGEKCTRQLTLDIVYLGT
jgi:hypothetical protein